MWDYNGNDISMNAGEYGLALEMTLKDLTIAASDNVKFTLKNRDGGATLIEKTFANIQQNKINLELTKAESESLRVGTYVYNLAWYQDGVFKGYLVPSAKFKVVGIA